MDKVKKVANKATTVVKKTGFKFDKATLVKLLASILPLITKGKVKRSDVLGVSAILIAGSNFIGPIAVQPEINNLKAQTELIQTQTDSIEAEQASILEYFGK